MIVFVSILATIWLIGTVPVWRAFRRDRPNIGLWDLALEVVAALCWPIWVAGAGAIASVFAYQYKRVREQIKPRAFRAGIQTCSRAASEQQSNDRIIIFSKSLRSN
jgi:peptidoglycan/LPS O-acetylase OafA/YrhL